MIDAAATATTPIKPRRSRQVAGFQVHHPGAVRCRWGTAGPGRQEWHRRSHPWSFQDYLVWPRPFTWLPVRRERKVTLLPDPRQSWWSPY